MHPHRQSAALWPSLVRNTFSIFLLCFKSISTTTQMWNKGYLSGYCCDIYTNDCGFLLAHMSPLPKDTKFPPWSWDLLCAAIVYTSSMANLRRQNSHLCSCARIATNHLIGSLWFGKQPPPFFFTTNNGDKKQQNKENAAKDDNSDRENKQLLQLVRIMTGAMVFNNLRFDCVVPVLLLFATSMGLDTSGVRTILSTSALACLVFNIPHSRQGSQYLRTQASHGGSLWRFPLLVEGSRLTNQKVYSIDRDLAPEALSLQAPISK